MKIIINILLILTTIGAFAQEKSNPADDAKKLTNEMVVKLKLTKAQETKLLSLNEKREIEKRIEIVELNDIEKNKDKIAKEEILKRTNNHLKLAADYDLELKNILSEAQYNKWQKHKKQKAKPTNKSNKPDKKTTGNKTNKKRIKG